ncbi:MAG: dockerin type I repeat-containing protein [Ruminococcus sp.]|nr:dockerin type I repeat-containing protein [Ruminococcus sp.]
MKKIISMLLVIAMMLTVLTVGIATTSAAETATITIYGLDGSSNTEEFNVGDEFTVYSTLDVSGSVSNGMIGSVQGTQTYSSDKLQLVDEVSGEYGEIAELAQVFPITGESTMANGGTAGVIKYNASIPSITSAFKFDTPYSKLIVTTYKVTAAGSGEVRNALRNLAIADENLTRIVYEGETQDGKSFAGGAYFEDPRPAIDHAEVTVYSLDGRKVTKSFNIGDTFTVYTTLDVSSSVPDGKVSSIQGVQKYTSSVLALNDATDSEGMITDVNKVFPITKDSTIAVAGKGSIKYSVATAGGFTFNSEESQLITTTYKVTANGYADITNKMIVLAAADEDVTRIVFGGETQPGMSYSLPAYFEIGEFPTEPVSDKLKVTIVNPDNTMESKEFSVGDTFTVYTTLDVTSSSANGQVACLEGTQTFAANKLQLTDATTGTYHEFSNKTAVFPVLGNEAVASAVNGTISFNASKPAVNNAFKFDGSKLIVTNYKVTATGSATIKTALKTLIAADSNLTKIVYNGATQSGKSYKMPGSFIDPTAPTEAETQAPTQPATQPATQAPTQKPTEAQKNAVVTIYGIDGTSATKVFNVGDTFTVYTTFDASKAVANSMIGSISATQSFTSSVLKSADAVDQYGVVTDLDSMFPIFKDKAVAHITEGLNKYNASTPNIGNAFKFDSDKALLIVSKYTVTAPGIAEIRNNLTTVAAADIDLTRIVERGEVNPGFTIGGKASFTKPVEGGVTFLLGDSDDNDEVESIDATYIQRYNSFMDVTIDEDIMMRNGDVDQSGDLEIIDATYIQRYIAFMDVKYPVGEYITI